MQNSLGVLLSVSTLLLWSVGDFYIQKSTRLVGIWKSLFFISFFGMVLELPFVWVEVQKIFLSPQSLILLVVLGLSIFLAALLDFEALKRGKIAVVEPVFGLGIPFTVFLAVVSGHDILSLTQSLLIGAIFIGIILSVVVKGSFRYDRIIWEKGVFIAILGTLAMALTNFLTGIGSQLISPLMTIWFINFFLTITTFVYLFAKGEWRSLPNDLRRHSKVILEESLFDNIAWLSYAFAMTLIPISISTSIAESYIVMAVLLGVSVNKETLNRHQVLGVILAVLGVISLSLTVTG
ncbi:MAG: EamA family transporter [Candidatus Pacebacteria bacterium]|nr:EamA family transporter [Candidatus Paceibacterota bacterium]